TILRLHGNIQSQDSIGTNPMQVPISYCGRVSRFLVNANCIINFLLVQYLHFLLNVSLSFCKKDFRYDAGCRATHCCFDTILVLVLIAMLIPYMSFYVSRINIVVPLPLKSAYPEIQDQFLDQSLIIHSWKMSKPTNSERSYMVYYILIF
ncbi:hypothetical protein L9F63_021932, partial [Diploptera punctata]